MRLSQKIIYQEAVSNQPVHNAPLVESHEKAFPMNSELTIP